LLSSEQTLGRLDEVSLGDLFMRVDLITQPFEGAPVHPRRLPQDRIAEPAVIAELAS